MNERVGVGSALGIGLDTDWSAGRIVVQGSGGQIPATAATLDCAASGTTIRFLAAVCGLGHGTYRLDGTARMRKRPIGDLLDALQSLGVEASAESPGGCPPVAIHSAGMPGGATTVRGGTSSQFASALAMVAPCTPAGMTIDFEGRWFKPVANPQAVDAKAAIYSLPVEKQTLKFVA